MPPMAVPRIKKASSVEVFVVSCRDVRRWNRLTSRRSQRTRPRRSVMLYERVPRRAYGG